MFGNLSDGNCRLKRFITRRNANRRDRERNYELEIQHQALPQESIVVEVDDRQVKERAALEDLAGAIEEQWYAITDNATEWEKVKAARKARANAPVVAKETPPADSAKTTAPNTSGPGFPSEMQEESAPLPQPVKPLAEVFRSLSVASIQSHIVAALTPGRGSEAIEASLTELLSPECVNVMAERLTSESIDSFCQFYFASYDDSQKIRKSIAAVIASHPELRRKLAATVARSGFSDIKGWFNLFSNFCDRKILYDLEQALNVASEEPGFKERFLPYAPAQLPLLIECFSRHGLVCAVRIFEKINQEGKKLYGE